jgi:hypothetical protein
MFEFAKLARSTGIDVYSSVFTGSTFVSKFFCFGVSGYIPGKLKGRLKGNEGGAKWVSVSLAGKSRLCVRYIFLFLYRKHFLPFP